MVDRSEENVRGKPGLRRVRFNARLIGSRRLRSALAIVPRIVLLLVIVWAFTGPIERAPLIAGAAGLVPGPVSPDRTVRAGPMFPETGFAVADGPIGSYFAARGGARTFGPPISNPFPLLGSTVQLFRNHLLKVETSGAVTTVDLFGMNAIPFRNVGGVIVPEVDPYLVATAPVPGSPDYATRALAFIQETAPDQWESLPVGFYQTFLGTVKAEEALPAGGEVALLPLFSQEIWGVPVSRPVRDAQNPDAVVQRWERGVMVWSRASGSVTAVPLGDAFKSLLTGDGLGPERTAAASGSQFLLQYAPTAPDGVARPVDLPDSVLAGAFGEIPGGIAAAQLSDPTATPTPPPAFGGLPPAPGAQPATDGGLPPPPGAQPQTAGGLPPPPPGGSAPLPQAGAAPPLPGAVPAAGVPAPGAPGAAVSSAADRCYGDEQITFSPAEPRVANEMLVAVTSSRPHPYGRLAGTEKTTFVRERPGQLGTVWEWTIPLTWPGKHEYTFYVDSTIPCKKIEITVRQSLATRTPTPTKTATPWGWDNGNNNNSNNNNDNNNNNAFAPFRDPNQFIFGANSYDCSFFQSQGEAQRVLRANTSDPNMLDTENNTMPRDGVACREYNYNQYPNDRDTNPVF